MRADLQQPSIHVQYVGIYTGTYLLWALVMLDIAVITLNKCDLILEKEASAHTQIQTYCFAKKLFA